MRNGPVYSLFAALISASGWTMTEADLNAVLEQRLADDRSGVCVAVARVSGGQAVTSTYCANADRPRAIDGQARFEIGSISKAMQGVLVARLADQGLLDLDEPLAKLLPEGATVPGYHDQEILLRHVLTHTAGLPRLPGRMPMADPANPYADMTDSLLLASLAEVELDVAPGTRWQYSNMGAMLLSLALTERTGLGLDKLFEHELFAPLGMAETGLDGAVIPGHDGNGQPVAAWTFPTSQAGVGGLRSSLGDMVRWLQAMQGHGPDEIVAAMSRSAEELARVDDQSLAWGWLRLPVDERRVLAHDGGTGGFSSFMAIDIERDVASVVLADTSMIDQGSLGDLALHLVDSSVPLGKPRAAAQLPAGTDLADYVGDYPLYQNDEQFMGDFVLVVFAEDQQLYVQGTGGGIEQPPFALDPDGKDRFVHPGLQLELRFTRDADGRVDGLDFVQAGHPLQGRRR